jgi:hypothetical protein
MWMRSCAVSRALLRKLRLCASVRCQCGWIGSAIGVREMKEVVMAKVIEFYVPTHFRRPSKAASHLQVGNVVEFCLQPKKSA